MPDPDLGPKPDAEIEPGEPHPGGVDAVPQADGVDGEFSDGDPTPRDLPRRQPRHRRDPARDEADRGHLDRVDRGDDGEGDSYEGASEVETE